MKILILTAATGGGHLRASSALKSYILETQEDCEVEIVDTLKYISPLLDKTVTEAMKPWQSGREAVRLPIQIHKPRQKQNHLFFLQHFPQISDAPGRGISSGCDYFHPSLRHGDDFLIKGGW